MFKFLIIVLIFISLVRNVNSQLAENVMDADSSKNNWQLADSTSYSDSIMYNYQMTDTLTYKLYLAGDWKKLISVGTESIEQQVDFKRLRQRLGYAYFVTADYYSAMQQYEAALAFDTSDTDTRLYLYYCGLYTGNEPNAKYHLCKLPIETQKYLKAKPFKLVSAVDVEYNYKANDDSSGIRSNPTYYRLGISTQLSYRLNLYQALSQYIQTVNVNTSTVQTEYYGLVNWSINSHSTLDIAYHYVNTNINSTIFGGNMFFAQLLTKTNRFRYGVNGSMLTNMMGDYTQIGLSGEWDAGTKSNIYLKSSINYLLNTTTNSLIYTQKIGFQLLKKTWIEGSVTFGNLKNYSDNNGLYLYNSLDATVFRTGVTVFQQLSKNISLFGNYTFDIKQIDNKNNSITNYNQHSISGGIIWKL